MRRLVLAVVVLVLVGCGSVVEPPTCAHWEHPTPYLSVCAEFR